MLFWRASAGQTFGETPYPTGAILRLLIWQTAISYSFGAHNYIDQALTPVSDDEDEQTLDLFAANTHTGARAAVAHVKKIAELTGVRLA